MIDVRVGRRDSSALPSLRWLHYLPTGLFTPVVILVVVFVTVGPLQACSTMPRQHDGFPQNPDHGQLFIRPNTQAVDTVAPGGLEPVMDAVIWYQPLQRWLNVESFWRSYAESLQQGQSGVDQHGAQNTSSIQAGGKFWGESTQYPEYADVSELDTLMIRVDDAVCLMQFYHSRWRRAQDVRRWDEALNRYGACPIVFEN